MERLQVTYEENKPIDFEERWNKWLKEVHDVKNNIEILETKSTSYGKEYKFYYDSVANTKIFAILYLPNNPKGIACYYHGYGINIEDERIIAHCMNLVNNNLAVAAIDMRFQSNRIIDNNEYNYKTYSLACYNVDDLERCYSKRLNQDALKLIDIIKDNSLFKEINCLPLIVTGPSQGGGLSLMVGAFCDVDLIICDIPSDCCLKERVLGKYGKYGKILDFINDNPMKKDSVLCDQGYFDVVNMASKIKAPIFSSVGMEDNICPPQYFYCAYQKVTGEKHLCYYDGYGHGGFESLHLTKKLEFINKKLKNC